MTETKGEQPKYTPWPAPTSRRELEAQIKILAGHMLDMAVNLEYFGGMAGWALHGSELRGAAEILRSWAEDITGGGA